MEKGLLKRRIGREWLILVGTILVGLIGCTLINYAFEKKYQQEISQRNEKYGKLVKEYELLHRNDEVSQLKKQYAKLVEEYESLFGTTIEEIWYPGSDKKKASWLRERLPPGAIKKIDAESVKKDSWLGKRLPPEPLPFENVPWLYVFLPYIITQFIRSIIWASKEILSKA